ncbi:MAG: paraquat-inducible protein A [Methylococcales bacterium]|jgi:paraquat-inducible protein A|nr:paraquat-inducible protein A [Methylococcales bacterium]MBT7409715.1 paraquat-inducible protein A [Methylococcales bacterium]
MNNFLKKPQLTACHECDALQIIPVIQMGWKVNCVNCGHLIMRLPRHGLQSPLAFYLTVLLLLIFANAFPFLSLNIEGRIQQITLFESVLILQQYHMGMLAIVVGFTLIIAPFLEALLVIFIVLSIYFHWHFSWLKKSLKWVGKIQFWSMLDVFLLAVLVSFVKLTDIAEVVVGTALLCFVALVFVYVYSLRSIDFGWLWSHLRQWESNNQ